MKSNGGQAELFGPIWQPLENPTRLRANDVIRFNGRLCLVLRVNYCAATILMNRPVRFFTTRFGKPRTAPPEPVSVVEVPKPPEPPPSREVVSSLPKAAEDSPPARKVSTDLGKGGEQHKAMQHRIKEAAETLGFHSIIEKQIADGSESIDLYLERQDQKFACEISVSTTIDHEVGNVRKCLKAGISPIAIICTSKDRLEKIAAAVAGSLGAEAAAGVVYQEPDQFIAHLKTLPLPEPKDSTTVRRGYKVKRSSPKLTDGERLQREEAAQKIMAEAIRPRR